MGKRTRVPAALHSELTEYASLLRALRTSNTLDLASQLTSAPVTASASLYGDEHVQPVLDDEGESERPSTTTDSQDQVDELAEDDDASVRKLKRKAKQASKKKLKAPKDNWTRWPLLAGDVHVPEWNLEDEVKLLATQALEAQLYDLPSSSPNAPQQVIDHPSEEAVTEMLSPITSPAPISADAASEKDDSSVVDAIDSLLSSPVLGALSASSGRLLSQILALLAACVPSGEKSMQNRRHPVNWESVLDIVTVNGLVDES